METKKIALVGTWVLGETCLKKLEKGRPPSLAKAKAMRDAAVITDIPQRYCERTIAMNAGACKSLGRDCSTMVTKARSPCIAICLGSSITKIATASSM